MGLVKLMIGTNETKGRALLTRHFKGLSWWSNNLETLAHYYEGCAIEMTVRLDPNKEMEFVCNYGELEELGMNVSEYEYGFSEVIYPKGATWYSFSEIYLMTHVVDIREVFPDLREFNEEE